MKKLIIFSLMLLVILTACIFDPKDEKETKGKISGVVKDATTSQPLNAVNVSIPNVKSTSTNSNGEYSFEDLEAKEHVILLNKAGYLENSQNIKVMPGKTTTADVQLLPIAPRMSVSTEFLNFGSQALTKTFTISNDGTGELNWTISPTESWVSITPTSGIVTTGSTPVTVTVNKTGMPYGNHSATITISSNANSKTIEAFVVVPDPTGLQLSAYPTILNFDISGTSMELKIQNTGTGMLSWNIASDSAWLTSIPATGTTQTEIDNITINVNRYGLTPGLYTGNLHINSDGGAENITVNMEVSNQPLLLVQPQSLNFGTDQKNLTFQIQNAGEGTLTWNIVDDQTWITQTPTSGTNNKDVTVTINRTGMSEGLYNGNIQINSNSGSQNVTILMEVKINLPDGVTLLEPTNLTGSAVDLSWSRYTNGDFAAYRLYRHTSPTVNNLNGTLVKELLHNTNQTYTDTKLQPETTYYYKIYVLTSSEEMLPSNTISITTPPQLGQWYTVKTTGSNLYSIDMLNEDYGFAVGYNGDILSYNGSSWTSDSSPTYADLSDVKIISESNVMAICTQTIYKFNGVSWSAMEEPEGYYNYYYSMTALDANHIWIGGDAGKIYFYNGSSWSIDDLDYSSIAGIYAVDANNVFAFDSNGKIIHYNGIGWSELTNLNYGYFNSIIAFSQNDIWIGGDGGNLFHYDGSGWQKIDVAGHHIFDICGLESNNIWFASNAGKVLHWDGYSVQSVTTSISSNIFSIKMISNSDGWAVGQGGKILRYQ